jgi:hypothetical protein
MKSEIILSALAGTLFSQAFAAPLVPAELAQDQVLAVLNFAPVGTPVAKRAAEDGPILNQPLRIASALADSPIAKRAVGGNQALGQPFSLTPVAAAPAKTPIARRAADDSPILNLAPGSTPVSTGSESLLNLPFQIAATPVAATPIATPVAKRAACDIPLLCDSADVPIAKRAAQDDNDLPLGSTNGNVHGSGFYSIYWNDVTAEAFDDAPPVKRAIAGSNDAPPVKRAIAGSNDAPPVKRAITGFNDAPPVKRAIAGSDDDMSSSGFYSIYWSDVAGEAFDDAPVKRAIFGADDAPPVKRAIFGSDDAPPVIRDSHSATVAN